MMHNLVTHWIVKSLTAQDKIPMCSDKGYKKKYEHMLFLKHTSQVNLGENLVGGMRKIIFRVLSLLVTKRQKSKSSKVSIRQTYSRQIVGVINASSQSQLFSQLHNEKPYCKQTRYAQGTYLLCKELHETFESCILVFLGD